MRFVFYILAVCLLIPLLIAITVWVRSFKVSDELTVDLPLHDGPAWRYARHALLSGHGNLIYYRRGWSAHHATDPPSFRCQLNNYRVMDPSSLFLRSTSQRGRWGFSAMDEVWGEIGAQAVIIPFWAPTLLSAALAIPPIFLARRAALRAHRGKNGLCLSCGYDIRESKERCPECGWKINRGMDASPMLLGTTGEAPVPRES